MEPLRSVTFRTALVLWYLGVLSAGDRSSCTPGITMEGNQNSGTLSGQSFVLSCLVRLCDLELPDVTWCKIAEQQCDPVRTRAGIYSKLGGQKEDSVVYVLKFYLIVQINDTGYYQCKAKFKNHQIVGRPVELNIAGVVTVRRGDPAVLQCDADPGDTFLSVTWSLLLYNSSCVISYKVEEDNTKTSYSSCSPRMSSDHLSLTISNTDVSDEGLYTCEVVNDKGTFFRIFSLQVLGVVTVRRGDPAVLQCDADPGDTLLSVTWKLHLYNSSCVISYKVEEDDTKTSYSSCSPRMRSDHLSLTINNTEISDGGLYTCEVVNDKRMFFRIFSLQVLAQPSTFLKMNSDGSPECGAIGGNPPAEISWIPDSDAINTAKLEDLDRTWSVISTIRRKRINGMSVTCVVSHPTFVKPWKVDISLSGGYELRFDNFLRLIVTVIFTVLFIGFLLYLRTKCQVYHSLYKSQDWECSSRVVVNLGSERTSQITDQKDEYSRRAKE